MIGNFCVRFVVGETVDQNDNSTFLFGGYLYDGQFLRPPAPPAFFYASATCMYK